MDPKAQSEAINQDVTDVEIPTMTSPESPRAKALAAIEESHRARMEEELGTKFSDDPAPAAEEPAPEDDQLKQQLADPEPTTESQKYKVKIDGVEQEVSAEEMIRVYQKNSAADRRLEEAARLLREAEQLAAQKPEPAQDPAPVEENLREDAAKVLSTLYDGDQEAATEALVNLLSKAKGGNQPTPQPAVDPDVLTEKVLERMALNTAFERVKSDYPDIIADPNLEALAAMQINQQVSMGIPRADAMLSVADGLYKSLGKTPNGRQPDAPTQQKSTRQENKERLDNVPSASATATSPVQNGEPNQSALLKEIAARRIGQSMSV